MEFLIHYIMVFDFLDSYVPGGNLYVKAFLIFVGFFVLSKLSLFIAQKIILRITAKTKTDVDDLIVSETNLTFSFILILLGLKFSVEIMPLSDYIGKIVVGGLNGLLIMSFAKIIAKVLHILIENWGKKWASKTKGKADDQLVSLFHRYSTAIVYIIGVVVVLETWGVSIGPVLASLGVAGIAVAFALQSSLANIFGGITLILDRTIEVGDTIKLDDGTLGDVIFIGLRSTKIKSFDNELFIIPNGSLANMKIQNFVPPDPTVRVVIPFGVCYGSDIDRVKKIVMKELKKIEGYIDEPEPVVRFLEMANSSLNFKAYFYVDSYTKRFNAIDVGNTLIYNTLKKNKIEIPFPQMDVHIKKD